MNNHVSFVYMIQFKSQGEWFFSVIEPNRYNFFQEANDAAIELSKDSFNGRLPYRIVGFHLQEVFAEISKEEASAYPEAAI